MTKSIRVENADTSTFKVVIEVWDKGIDGGEDILAETHDLSYPTALKEIAIWDTRYLKVKEVE